ncbi:uncharacterized protein il17rc [Eucyclogobius newberryi]|uniref:uncharacterized protein il17rc n=1 Tax=Eucyclogobius newberryi TaxID=166745 RepID=UPI003B5ADF27
MFTPGCIIWLLLLTARLSLCNLDIVENDREVTCSQGLWNCTMKDGTMFDSNSVEVTNLSTQVKLCCRGDTCELCLQLQVEVNLNQLWENEGNSGMKEDDGTEETKNDEAEKCSVTVCYKTPHALPMCKKVEFMVKSIRFSQQSTAQISATVFNAVISYENNLFVYSNVPDIRNEVHVPSLENVCGSNISMYVQECNGLKLSFLTNKVLHQVELSFPDSDSRRLKVCIQNETNGKCKIWNRAPIPLVYVTPCTCVQAWKEDGQVSVRSRRCPFKNNTTLRSIMWKNIILSVERGFYNFSTRLWWNISAPCRLEGELWPCERTPGPTVCTEIKGFRQQLGKDVWIQNKNDHWEKRDVLSQIGLENDPCVMVQITGMEYEMGPFCYNSFDRWRWSLFAVAVMLLLSLTLLITLCLRDFVKKSVWSWHHGGFVQIHQAHVLVLSPPDSDGEVSSAVCSLGSLLCSSGFSVTVDQWSRRGQLNSGPLPWTHCQLLSMDSTCERVLLVLTAKAVDKAQKWSNEDSSFSDQQEESPYSDVFRASLFAIQAYKHQGKARERFILVTFDSHCTEAKICHNKLPEILQGLPLFHFPSQTKALLSDLCVGRAQRWSKRSRWTLAFPGN